MNADTQNQVELLTARLDGSIRSLESLRTMLPDVLRVGNTLLERLEAGGVLYTAGNGGSAAQALHLAEELIGRYRSDRQPLPAICLNADPTALTCIANDFGYDSIFARQCKALLGGLHSVVPAGWLRLRRTTGFTGTACYFIRLTLVLVLYHH